MTHKATITSEEMKARLQRRDTRRLEYNRKSASYMSKQTRNECIVKDFNALIVVKRVFPKLMDVYNLLGEVYGLNATTVFGIVKRDAELTQLAARRSAMI